MHDEFSRICVQCEQDFSLTEKELSRHRINGFDLPLRCPECRKHKLKHLTPAKWDRRKVRPRKSWILEEEFE
jgi:NAD-dependent SIR2 family protein deacetylase